MRLTRLWQCVAVGVACVMVGCNNNPFTGGNGIGGLPKEYQNMALVLSELVRDQGILKDFDGAGRVDVMDPGGALYTKTEVGFRIVGTNADLELNVDGTGTRMPAGMRDALLQQLAGPISDAQRDAILTILGYNRQPGNPGGPTWTQPGGP